MYRRTIQDSSSRLICGGAKVGDCKDMSPPNHAREDWLIRKESMVLLGKIPFHNHTSCFRNPLFAAQNTTWFPKKLLSTYQQGKYNSHDTQVLPIQCRTTIQPNSS